MTITIRNNEPEATIRRIGERPGEEPETVIARAVQRLNGDAGSEKERFDANFARLMAARPPRDPNLTWKDIENEMNSIF